MEDEVIVIHELEVRFHGFRACFKVAKSGAHGNNAFQSECTVVSYSRPMLVLMFSVYSDCRVLDWL